MAKTTKPAAKAEPTTTDEKASGLERVLSRTAVQPNWKAFSEFVEANGGPKINPKHVGIVLTGYKFYQQSDAAVEVREATAKEKADAKEQRDAARAAKAKAASEAKAEKAAKPAKATKAAAKKAAPAKPAAAAKPAGKKGKGGKKAKAAF